MIIRSTVYHRGCHLRHDQLTLSKEACPVCGATGPRRSLAVIQHNPTVDLLLCGRCGGSSASHMPLPEVLLHYYRKYYKPGDQPKVTMGSVSRFATHIRSALPTTMAIKPDELTISTSAAETDPSPRPSPGYSAAGPASLLWTLRPKQ